MQIMPTNTELQTQYEALLLHPLREFDPRVGIYQITSTYNDTCYNKPALMANVCWKPNKSEVFDFAMRFVIQLESLKRTATDEQLYLFNNANFEDVIFEVTKATIISNSLALEWIILKPVSKVIGLRELNNKLSAGYGSSIVKTYLLDSNGVDDGSDNEDYF